MKFELSHIVGENGEAGTRATVRLTFETKLFAGQSFAVNLRYCPNPCCSCSVAGFECVPEAEPEEQYRFDLDVTERRIDEEVRSAPEEVALGRAFLAEAQEEHWVWLLDWLITAKRRLMDTMDLDALEVDLPAEVMAGEGTMVSYSEVFPWATTPRFTFDAAEWFVDDQHCVRPGCDCTKAGLGFFPVRVESVQPAPVVKSSAYLFFDYRTGKSKLITVRPGSPAPSRLLKALLSSERDLAETLRHRHGQLKQLGRRLMPESVHNFSAGLSPAGGKVGGAANGDGLLQPSTPQVQRALQEPGRNDPCPCGSGRKFKRCCGGA